LRRHHGLVRRFGHLLRPRRCLLRLLGLVLFRQYCGFDRVLSFAGRQLVNQRTLGLDTRLIMVAWCMVMAVVKVIVVMVVEVDERWSVVVGPSM
jgi:uncharacterized membrane protein (DUF485 family)